MDTAEPVAVELAVEMNWASHPIVPSHPSQVSPARRHMLALAGFLAHCPVTLSNSFKRQVGGDLERLVSTKNVFTFGL